MRLRNVPGAREAMVESEYVVNEPKEYKGRWNELFGNSNPIRIEVGMGKGRFIMQLAAENPDVNYVGIEKYSSVLIRALEKQEEAQLPNIIFIRMDAEEITDVFGEGEVDRIYLNFSCLLYTSDAADEEDSVDLGGRRIIKKKKRVRAGGRGTE